MSLATRAMVLHRVLSRHPQPFRPGVLKGFAETSVLLTLAYRKLSRDQTSDSRLHFALPR